MIKSLKLGKIKFGTLKFNVLSMFFSNFFYAVSYWLQLSLISKYTNPTLLGNYTLTLAIILPLYKFTNMQLRSLIISDQSHIEEVSLNHYFSYRIITLVGLILLATGIYLVIDINPTIFFFVLSIKVIEGLSDIVNAKFQQIERMHFVTVSVMLKSLLGMIGFVVGIVFFENIFYAFLFAFFANLLVFIFYDFRKLINFSKFVFHIDNQVFTHLFKLAFPLAITMLIISLNVDFSKYYLEYFNGAEKQGIYSSIQYLIILGTFVVNAVGQAFVPRLSTYFMNNETMKFIIMFKKYLLFNVLLGSLGILVALFFGDFILGLLYNKMIASYSHLFVWMMVYGLGVYIMTVCGYTITAMREFKLLPYINGLNLFLTVSIGYFAVKNYGLEGAVFSSIIAIFSANVYALYLIINSMRSLG